MDAKAREELARRVVETIADDRREALPAEVGTANLEQVAMLLSHRLDSNSSNDKQKQRARAPSRQTKSQRVPKARRCGILTS